VPLNNRLLLGALLLALAGAKEHVSDRAQFRDVRVDLRLVFDVVGTEAVGGLEAALFERSSSQDEHRPQDGQEQVVVGVCRQGPVHPEEAGCGRVTDEAVGEVVDDLSLGLERPGSEAALVGAEDMVGQRPQQPDDQQRTQSEHGQAGRQDSRRNLEDIPPLAVGDRAPEVDARSPDNPGDGGEDRALEGVSPESNGLLVGLPCEKRVGPPPNGEEPQVANEVILDERPAGARPWDNPRTERVSANTEWIIEDEVHPVEEDHVRADKSQT